jgi:uncharacterized delta-60 repeat protein
MWYLKDCLRIAAILAISSMGSASAIDAPSDQPTIQEGIDAAVEGDTDLVADGQWNRPGDFGKSDIGITLNHGPYQRWVARYNGPGSGGDVAKAIALDADGNVYVTGYSRGSGTADDDYATVKYDTDGNELWVARYNGPEDNFDVAYAIALDEDGNVYVTGYAGWNYGSGFRYADYATVKYDTNGNEQWVARYNGPGDSYDYARAIALDADGNVYVTGWSYGGETGADYATVKYDTDGNELWVSRYNYGGDCARAIALDQDGNVYVTGGSEVTLYSGDYATVKYDTNGNEQWVARYNGPGNYADCANSIALDADGNAYVTGWSSVSETDEDYATIKYDTAGNELWVARYNGPGNDDDWANAIAVDVAGSVFVTGYSSVSGTDVDYATIKYNTNGNELWIARYNGPGNTWDRAGAIALDPEGNVYVTGGSEGSGTDSDYATIKYDTDGNQLWIRRYNGPIDDSDCAVAIALDLDGNVYVTGGSYWGGTSSDYTTIKYSRNPPAQKIPIQR